MVKKPEFPEELDEKWAPAIFRYVHEVMFNKNEIDSELETEITIEMTQGLAHIGELFADKFRANDIVNVMRHNHCFQEVFLQFGKLKTQIFFGFDEKGFYVNNHLSFQENLKSTNDKFWSTFFNLFDCGKVNYENGLGSSHPLKKDLNKIFERNHSSCMHIFKDLIGNSLFGGEILIDRIEVEIGDCKSNEELYTKIFRCIEIFQSLNYQLYHINYLGLSREKARSKELKTNSG